jgi:hypothetical protein
LGSGCMHIVTRGCFNSIVRVWGIQRHALSVSRILVIWVRTVSGEIVKVSAIVRSEALDSACRIAWMPASTSCRHGLPGRPSLRSSSLPRRISWFHRNTDARQYASSPYTFWSRVAISSPAHPSRRRNSMTVRFFVTSIVTFWLPLSENARQVFCSDQRISWSWGSYVESRMFGA